MSVTRSRRSAPGGKSSRRPARYLTDGVRLFCVLDTFQDARRRPLRLIEDCRSLEIELVDADAFRQRELRPVRRS